MQPDGHGAVLIAVTSEEDVDAVVDLGVSLARAGAFRVTVVGISAASTPWAWSAPIALPCSPESLRRAGLDEAARLCRRAVDRIPGGISVEHRVFEGCPRRLITALLDTGHFGAVVLHERRTRRGRLGRAAREWRRCGVDLRLAA